MSAISALWAGLHCSRRTGFYWCLIQVGWRSSVVMRLLFVCVGNTCRSQMAEALARHMGHEAASAGTHRGDTVASNSLAVLQEIGVSTEGLSPKSVDDVETEGWDMIISMGCGVHCPMLPIAEDWGLDDPVGGPIDVYRSTRDTIVNNLERLSAEQTDA